MPERDAIANPTIEIDATIVALALGLELEAFRRLMDTRRITVLCERGTGEDAGTYRASFYHGARRARLVVDRHGRTLPAAEQDARSTSG